ncbi:uncharacterized protein LOC124450650 [Xenia sp. Carnegie-2017]|uniref:uncharacterized protein LOC124450650 n=1 Tax=Xenia sp. Carnegie-2017 TaxID=2897299 RepID=UPI001F03F40C|nr:uncharacterized protein LOC124450650 [Xenia sp. Carnegie-2017]
MAAKNRRVKVIREKLEALCCPYVENVDESWMSELLFKPGEPRLRLIQWLLSKFDPQLEELLDSHHAVLSNLSDSRVSKLLFCANLLALCRDDDVDLITGKSSKSKQLALYEHLIDLLFIVEDLSHPSVNARLKSEGSYSQPVKTLEIIASDACAYLDAVCQTETLDEIFKSKIHLFPPDIEKKLVSMTADETDRLIHIPEINELTAQANVIEGELNKQSEILNDLQTKCVIGDDAESLSNVSRTLSLTMSTLSQTLETFYHCYETEIKQWSIREKPHLSELGIVFKRIFILLDKLLQILSKLELTKMSYLKINGLETFDGERNTDHSLPYGQVALNKLNDFINTLEQSLKRKTEVEYDDSDSL